VRPYGPPSREPTGAAPDGMPWLAPSDIQYPEYLCWKGTIRYLSIAGSLKSEGVPFRHGRLVLRLLGVAALSCELLNETSFTDELGNRSRVRMIRKLIRIHD
jgi:hypothetical protein